MRQSSFTSLILYTAAAVVCHADTPVQDADCPPGPQSKRFEFRHLDGEGLGFNKGYSTFASFLSTSKGWGGQFFPFFDLRAHVFNDGKPAANLGLGGRYLFSSLCHALGGNVYYDFRKTNRKSYNQMGVGLEFLAPSWEMRANGYFPLSKTTSRLYGLAFDHFSSHYLYVRYKREFALTGGDFEAGWHFYRNGDIDLYAGAGPYYFKGKMGDAAIGGKARLVMKLGKYITLEGSDTYDSVFRNRGNGLLSINLPFGNKFKSKKSQDCSCDRQAMVQQSIYASPSRDEIVVLDTKRKVRRATDPDSGLPFFFWFVDNRSSSEGTFESPFPTLLEAELASAPGDVIYVFPGDGTTTGMAAGIFLKANQRFLGSAVSHRFQTQFGVMEVPVLSSTITRISGGGLATVTLSVNNEVSGFQIEGTGAGGPGVSGTFVGMNTNTHINRNIFVANPAAGIFISMAGGSSGTFLIENNTVTDPLFVTGIDFGFIADSSANITIQNNTIINAGLNGIFIDAAGSPAGPDFFSNVNLVIRGNTIIDSVAEDILVRGRGPNHIQDTLISYNTLIHTGAGPAIAMTLFTGDETIHALNVLHNTFLNIPGSTSVGISAARGAIPFSPTTGQMFLTIDSNTFRNGGEAMTITEGVGGPGFTQVSIVGNDISNTLPSFGAITLLCSKPAVPASPANLLTGLVKSNKINMAGDGVVTTSDGIGIVVSGPSNPNLDVQIIGNAISNVAESGVNCFLTAPTGTLRAEILSNRVENSGLFTAQEAIFISNDGDMRVHVEGNTLINNPVAGMNDINTATMCLRLNGNFTMGVPVGYILDNSGGVTFNTEVPVSNVGTISILGPVMLVPAGSCE